MICPEFTCAASLVRQRIPTDRSLTVAVYNAAWLRFVAQAFLPVWFLNQLGNQNHTGRNACATTQWNTDDAVEGPLRMFLKGQFI